MEHLSEYIFLQILKTIKQRNKNFFNIIIVFLLDNFIWTNRKQVEFYFYLPIGPDKIVQRENNTILVEILVSLFDCF